MEMFYKEVGTSRQAVSQINKRDKVCQSNEEKIISLVNIWREKHPRMGSRSLYYTLQNIGNIDIGIGVNKFEKLMSKEGLTNGKPTKKWIKTSDGLGKESYTNLINGRTLNNINQAMVGDITYYHLDGQMSYIFTLKDIYSQKILGLVPSLSLEATNAITCLQDAILQRKGQCLKGCIHHSDNGSQYNAKLYKECIANVGMKISRANNCLENGSAENLNGLVKNSYLMPWGIRSFVQLKDACKEVINLTNNQRAINDLGNLSPNQYEELIGKLPEAERPLKKLFDFENEA